MRRAATILSGCVLALLAPSGLFAEGFHGIHSPDGLVVWAVGNGGLVHRSFDGGATWGNASLDTVTLRTVFTLGSGVWMAGDGGIAHRSTDGGGSWTTAAINGGSTVRALFFSSSSHGWAAGDNGTILRTTDGGLAWVPAASGTAQALRSLWFPDSLTGFAAGDKGTLLRTTDAGTTWTSVAGAGWTSDLFSVSGRGATLYTTGVSGFAARSTNGGSTWSLLPFRTDSRSNITGVYAFSADSAAFIGGGGFIRLTRDGGHTSSWGLHQMHAPLTALHFPNPLTGFACSDKNNAVLRTTDGGATWSLPTGTTVSYAWTRTLVENSSIGNTFVIDAWRKDRLYIALGESIYVSTNVGESWSFKARITTGGSTHSFYVSPKDSNLYVAANTGGGDGVKRSTDGGVTWTPIIQKPFTSYGMPLEMNPDRPDTLLFAADASGSGGSDANGRVYRSTDFGLTWDTLAVTNLRSPCDIVIVPDSNALVYIGDGITGSGRGKMWKSENGGAEWKLVDSVSGSEIPTISISRLRNSQAFNTAWGSGGVRRTTDFGDSWTQVATTGSAWGTDVAKDDPNVIMFGVYGGGISYLSTNAGNSFPSGLQASLSGSNYAILAYDRATFLAQQSGGVYKLRITYTVPVSNLQTLSLTAPNGGETWEAGTIGQIMWAAGNFSNVRIEYKTSPASAWQMVTASTPAPGGSYGWTVPNTPTTQARVRISDASDGVPSDTSSGTFTISAAAIAASPSSLLFDTVETGAGKKDTLRLFNTGTAPLVIGAITAATVHFTPGRSSFVIPVGGSDTLSVWFAPLSPGPLADTLQVQSNAPGGTMKIPLSGLAAVPAPGLIAPPAGAQYVAMPVGFVWENVPGAVAYHLQIGTDSLFSALLVDDSTIVTPGAQIAGLPEGTMLFWRAGSYGGGVKRWAPASRFTTSVAVTQDFPVSAGWNMLALPLRVADARPPVVFSAATSGAFAYAPSAGYVLQDTLQNGRGYWLKFGEAGSAQITGQMIGGDTIDIAQGWNMIGSLSVPADTGSIVEIPPGIVRSAYFGYSGGYAAADTLRPARAYWVKAGGPGQIILMPLLPVPDLAPAAARPPEKRETPPAKEAGDR